MAEYYEQIYNTLYARQRTLHHQYGESLCMKLIK